MKRQTPTVLGLLALGLTICSGAQAQGYPMASKQTQGAPPSLETGQDVALGLSLFVGPTSGEPFQVITGYDGGTIYTATSGAVEATEQAIVLRRSGTYRIHLEGVLFMDKDDPTAGEDAAALFAILVNGIPWVVCGTPSNSGSPPLPLDFRATPDHEVAASCQVDFTVPVRGSGSPPGEFPLVLPRNSEVQAALIPNDRPLGDLTLLLTRIEISQVG